MRRSVCCPASTVRRWRRSSHAASARRAARFRSERGLPRVAPGAVRRDGFGVRAVALGRERPRVGLLSVGEEETKGNELTREAHRLLKESPVHFVGNVEGRDVFSGDADVIVCDGFTGNVTLKVSEGLVETVEALLARRALVDVQRPNGICALAAGVPTFPPPRRLLGIRRRAARRARRPVHRRPRPIVGQGGRQRGDHGGASRARGSRWSTAAGSRADRYVSSLGELLTSSLCMIAFVFPGQGAQKVGMGKALADAFPICRETFRRGR